MYKQKNYSKEAVYILVLGHCEVYSVLICFPYHLVLSLALSILSCISDFFMFLHALASGPISIIYILVMQLSQTFNISHYRHTIVQILELEQCKLHTQHSFSAPIPQIYKSKNTKQHQGEEGAQRYIQLHLEAAVAKTQPVEGN